MPIGPEGSIILAQMPDAREALIAIIDEERLIRPPQTLGANAIVGVIPPKMFETDIEMATLAAERRIGAEHERVMCARYGHPLDEAIPSTPDIAARNYLFKVGLVDVTELQEDTPAEL